MIFGKRLTLLLILVGCSIKNNKKICIEGRDIASKILAKNPKYDLAFYFKCDVKIAAYRRWLDLKKKVSLKEVKRSLYKI